ncbi:hypothetical protein BH23ACT2_BH23ACT2_26120 [soil metagenome]
MVAVAVGSLLASVVVGIVVGMAEEVVAGMVALLRTINNAIGAKGGHIGVVVNGATGQRGGSWGRARAGGTAVVEILGPGQRPAKGRLLL